MPELRAVIRTKVNAQMNWSLSVLLHDAPKKASMTKTQVMEENILTDH